MKPPSSRQLSLLQPSYGLPKTLLQPSFTPIPPCYKPITVPFSCQDTPKNNPHQAAAHLLQQFNFFGCPRPIFYHPHLASIPTTAIITPPLYPLLSPNQYFHHSCHFPLPKPNIIQLLIPSRQLHLLPSSKPLHHPAMGSTTVAPFFSYKPNTKPSSTDHGVCWGLISLTSSLRGGPVAGPMAGAGLLRRRKCMLCLMYLFHSFY